MNRLALSLAAFSILFCARSASADSSDDDDGFVESGKPEAQMATASPEPASPEPASPKVAAPIPVLRGRFEWGASTETPPAHSVASHASSQKPMRDQTADEDPHRGWLGPVRLGALAGVGAPSIFSGEVVASIGDYVGLAADYGVAPAMPFPMGSGAVTLQQKSFTGAARLYPFRNAFFIGGAFGSQNVAANMTAAAQGNSATANFSTSIFFLEPELGILYRSSSGISLGCDLGLEFPMTAQRSNSETLPAAMDKMMKYAEKGPIPSVNLLRIGYVL